ncbi:MAG: hypothetical protein EBT20_03505 [Alphaproteobacteria bacterium]|nr:hypothetical protein [Alphaproteobacteria bacterium]
MRNENVILLDKSLCELRAFMGARMVHPFPILSSQNPKQIYLVRALPEGLGFYAMNIKSCYGYMI